MRDTISLVLAFLAGAGVTLAVVGGWLLGRQRRMLRAVFKRRCEYCGIPYSPSEAEHRHRYCSPECQAAHFAHKKGLRFIA
jgi:hypothetical protein